jgi:hypothetical protein
MKTKFFLATFILTSAVLFGEDTIPSNTKPQWTDISLFHINRLDAKNSTPLIWVSHENGNYFLEGRVNFDWGNTAGLFLGKTFSKSSKFWITPKIGMLFGGRGSDEYNAIDPEFNFGGRLHSFEYFTMNQYAIAIDQHPDFVYQYTETRWHANKHLALCYAIQFYKEMVLAPTGGLIMAQC